MCIINVNKFLWLCYKNKELDLLDIYFSKLFCIKNNFDSEVIMLYSALLSFSSRLGNTCLYINKLLKKNIFSENINNYLFFFFKKYISIKKSINILFKNNIISMYYNNFNTPFILYNECIYLYKNWVYETTIINFFKINLNKKIFLSKKKILNILYYLNKIDIDIYQKISILNIFFNKVSIISGGPGTGKTTLITKIILLLYRFLKLKYKDSINIVSYTGKSASCLTNYINKNYDLLKVKKKIKKKLPNKAITLHKFLGLNFFYKKEFLKNNYILNINILIIDESSMIDLFVFYYMCILLNNRFNKIIFIGDSNQIGAIKSSSVFNEICKYKFSFSKNISFFLNFFLKYNLNFVKLYIDINKLNNNITYLIKNYRFNKKFYLNKFINLLNINDWNKIEKFLYKNNFNNNFNFYDSNKFNYDFLLKNCISNYIYYFKYIKEKNNFLKLLHYFNKFQIISVIKKTKYGLIKLNKYINNYFINNNKSSNLIINNNKTYYFGEPIIITKNNNDLKLFNGDTCFIIFENNKLKILHIDYKKKYKIIYFVNIKNWDHTWCITVHKSQGSEFDHVLLILPNYFSSLLNKELIYTALTRAKKKITIYADKDIFINSLKSNNRYYNNISKRISI